LNEKKGMEPKVATRAGYVVKEITVLEAHLSQHITKDQSHPLKSGLVTANSRVVIQIQAGN